MQLIITSIFQAIIKFARSSKSWRTTIVAIITAAIQALQLAGVLTIPKEVQSAIITIAVFLIGLIAADARAVKRT